MRFLLDANVLIALTVEEHEHHQPVARWIRGVDAVAVCPVVEGALVRFLVRLGVGPAAATTVLARMHLDPRCEFWADSLSYADSDLARVRGHRQVTDAYLVSLAGSRAGRLATLDRGLAQDRPDLTFLVPDR